MSGIIPSRFGSTRPSRAALLTGTLSLIGALLATTPASSAPRTCFGESATIVGTNRDEGTPVELHGTPRDDVIVGLGGWDIIDGRGGDDLICAGGGDDYVEAGGGTDKVRGQGGMDTLHGGRAADRLWGGRSPFESLVGGGGNDKLFGGPGGEDSLIGGPGDDRLDGGGGYDLAEFWDATAGVQADLGTGRATGRGADRLVSIEGLVGSRYNDVLVGDDLSNLIQGNEGNDTIRALGSSGDGGGDLLRSGGGEDVLDGGEGPDIVSYNLSPVPVTADLALGEGTTELGHDTYVGVENITGSKYDDSLTGDDADNLIVGNGGDDILDGAGGIDEIAFFDAREPVTADLGAGTAEVGAWGSDTFADFENLSGSAFPDVLTGDDGPNLIWGGDRNDTLEGLGGDDILLGARGSDEADGGDGTDRCEAETQVSCETSGAVAVLGSISWSLW